MYTTNKISLHSFDGLERSASSAPDLICLSHLRWDFVYQRPQHLLSRFAKERRVFFVEEPIFRDGKGYLDVSQRDDGVCVVVPHLSNNLIGDEQAVNIAQRKIIDHLFAQQSIREHLLWYYTPMAMPWTRHLNPVAIVYDCMDELSAFKGAPSALKYREAELFARADLVFTGGQSLYEAKRGQHPNMYAFPSSIDAPHFAQARSVTNEPADQTNIPHPRLGFFGVIDERLDTKLLDGVAAARPDWQLVIIGPVVKIDPADLPRRDNIHYLGGKQYKELPSYLAGWDVAMLPFARNESTRFISPTKTPEYLAAGRPVVSTSIHDVVRPYGQLGLVHIADSVAEFVVASQTAMSEDRAERLRVVDAFLARTSWDRTWGRMRELIDDCIVARRSASVAATTEPATVKPAARAASAATYLSGD